MVRLLLLALLPAAAATGPVGNAGAPDPNVSSAIIATFGRDYDRTRAPYNQTVVQVSATINKITRLSEKDQVYGLNFFFRQMWNDDRLKWDPADFGGLLRLTHVPVEQLWAPDTFFASANRADVYEHFTILDHDGNVTWSQRLVVEFFCVMDFTRYPFDVQTCLNRVESYGHSPEVLEYVLPDEGSEYGTALDAAAPDVRSIGTYTLTRERASKIVAVYQGKSFAGLEWRFYFSREWRRFMLTFFLPLWLIIFLSCAGQWINPSHAPARVAMGITTVLVLITLMYTLTRDLPESNRTIGVDWYFIVCIVVVVGNMTEYALVNHLLRGLERREQMVEGRRKHLRDLLRLVRLPTRGGKAKKRPQSPLARAEPSLPQQPPQPPQPPPAQPEDTAADGVRITVGEGSPTAAALTSPLAVSESVFGDARMRSMRSSMQTNATTNARGRTLSALMAPDDGELEGEQAMQLLLGTQRAELKEAFLMFDQDRSGAIDCDELQTVLGAIGASAQEVDKLMGMFDSDGTNTLDFTEFCNLMLRASDRLRNLQFHKTEVRAISFCGYGVTRFTIESIESTYRIASASTFSIVTAVWFLAIALSDPEV